ncbi:MAG: DNA-packaging protein [Acidobacteria bacterium]|nr:DNA-packaging protein [Acidobacteriota bacterium]
MARQQDATTSSTQKHPGGRPTKLTADLIEVANAYLDLNDQLGPAALLPTIERLALTLGVHRDTLRVWGDESQEFSAILERLRASQADKLLQNGLTGRYNSTIVKLVLTKHGYVEKQEVDQNVKGNVTFVNDVPRPPRTDATG